MSRAKISLVIVRKMTVYGRVGQGGRREGRPAHESESCTALESLIRSPDAERVSVQAALKSTRHPLARITMKWTKENRKIVIFIFIIGGCVVLVRFLRFILVGRLEIR